MLSVRTAALAAALCAAGAAPAAADVVFDYVGPATYDQFDSGGYAWPVVGYIAFDEAAFAPGATLGEADLVDLSFTVAWNAVDLTFALAQLSYIYAEFVVNAAGDGFDSVALGLEQEFYAGPAPAGPETLLLWDQAGTAIGINDQQPNAFPFTTSVSAAISSDLGQLTLRAAAIPAPAALPLLGAGVLLLGLAARRREAAARAAPA